MPERTEGLLLLEDKTRALAALDPAALTSILAGMKTSLLHFEKASMFPCEASLQLLLPLTLP